MSFISGRLSCAQGELEHHRIKHFYAQTNKHNFTQQVALYQRQECLLMNIQACVDVGKNKKSRLDPMATLSHKDEELLPYVQPTQHHYISGLTCEYSYLATWL